MSRSLYKKSRFLVLRRIIQLGTLVLFWMGARGFVNILLGNYSSSELLGEVPLSDPYAVLQILASGQFPGKSVLIGAIIVSLIYIILGGRVFCSWVCPVNPVTDLASWLRRKYKIGGQFRVTRNLRFYLMLLALPVSFAAGIAAFEWVSPVAIIHRELIFTAGLGLLVIPAIFLLDLLVIKNGWCGHICPLGAFYGLLNRVSLTRVQFIKERCDKCMDCVVVCPEKHVINFDEMENTGKILDADCTNCGRCIEVCDTDAYHFSHRFKK
jgi:ferredoxin-type protein NapH